MHLGERPAHDRIRAIVDRDFVELTNLQRQVMFDENDVIEGIPKAEAAKLKHRKIPTWEEAIDIVISANKETRSKSSGSGSRGRRRGRKKPQ